MVGPKVMLISLLLGLTGVIQSAVPDWTQLGLGYFAVIPVVLAAIWLGRGPAVAASLAASGVAAANIGGGPHAPSTAVLTAGAVIRAAGYVGIGLVVAESTARLRRLATTDPLTGLANRRAFFEWAPSFAPHGQRLTVVACDVNGLKLINDEFGHDRGDQAIIEAGRALKRLVGEPALVARVGGDEFLAVSARDISSLRAAASAAPTTAIGFAEWIWGQPLDEALKRADTDLYSRKLDRIPQPIVRMSERREVVLTAVEPAA
jgi:GGDEF domain-containing protein